MLKTSFKERFNYGEKAIKKTCKILDEKKYLKYKTTKEYFTCWNKEKDKEYGDIAIYGNFGKIRFVDVKRNSISIESLKKFKGDAFIIWNKDLTEAYIYNAQILKRAHKMGEIPRSILLSGDMGYKLENLKNIKRTHFFDILKIS